MRTQKGFTLIELLVVIAIIGMLASVILASLSTARKKSRDVRRLMDIKQVMTALEMQYNDTKKYPTSDRDGCGGWDVGNQTYTFMTNKLGKNMPITPIDPIATGNCAGYFYYRYSAGSYGCPLFKGAYYVLGIRDMETSARPYKGSPGWSCPNRNWQGEFDWVTGSYE